jgi:hypothetical protein
VRDYVVEHFATEDAVLVIDETGFLKQGKASCGVGRQYTGSAGKITNCQIGVFAAYVSRHGHAFIDRALYLPKRWTDDPARMAAAHVPPGTAFATKPAMALGMIARAITAGVPFGRVAADSVYGVGDIEMALRRAGKGYVLGVNATASFNAWIGKPPVAGTAEDIAKALDPVVWQRLSAGRGTEGERLHDWVYLELADLEAAAFSPGAKGLWTRGLLVRRHIADGEMAYFTTWCPAGTSIEALVAVEGHRWAIEDSFETAKNELGLTHNETLARLASPHVAGDAGIRDAGGDPPPRQRADAPKKAEPASQAPDLVRWSLQEIRRIATRLAQRRIQPATIITWSLWRRAHQAAAQQAHIKTRNCNASSVAAAEPAAGWRGRRWQSRLTKRSRSRSEGRHRRRAGVVRLS